ncbi:ricin B-like lectin R40G3 [Oryza brachyantha]|uniref:ricin B-like lectin R40G3 n=1 Tax=Oryza brachyantha TaxID=4533 RepID=UPI001ADAA56F|nr:ricin B-like lectin R40G3 [Oryza brachyantha]
MEFPHRHHGRRDDDDDDDRRRPPAYGYDAPPPPGPYGHPPPPGPYGQPPHDPYARHPPPSSDPYARHPPPPSYGRNDDYAPSYGAAAPGGYGNVVHVSHEVPDQRPTHYGGGGYGQGHGGSDYISPVQETLPLHGAGGGPVRQQTHRIYCKAGEDNYSLAVRDGKVCLVRSDRDDDTQHWVKDMKYSTRVKDEEGYPAMALVNKATGEALKHSLGQSHPVRLVRYNPEYMDESVLWTESRDVGSGFRCIRMVNNIYLNFDALHGDKDHGGVRDGTTLVLWEWCEGDNQRWKIVPW